jgi:hypothetical protein
MYPYGPGIANHMVEAMGSKFGPAATNSNKKKDTAYVNKSINNWEVIFGVNESGKLIIDAWRSVGKLRGKEHYDEAKLHFTLESTSNRVPLFVRTNYYAAKKGGYQPFVEIDDGKDRMTESYKTEQQYYKRQFHKSSILTTQEFLSEQVPSFADLIKDKRLNEYVYKITDECYQVQKPYNKQYVIVGGTSKSKW